MGCASCNNMYTEMKEAYKEGKVLKAALVAVDGVAVASGLKNVNPKYLDMFNTKEEHNE